MKGLVCGIGINDLIKYGKRGQGRTKPCPFQLRWRDTLKRCYSEKYIKKNPTYTGCSFVPEWLLASNFKEWMSQQDWEGKHLDKDILFPGNKVYGPDTCVFISQELNHFITESEAKRGIWPIGVTKDVNKSRFQARCNIGKGKLAHLGYFDSPEEAHSAWLAKKLELAYVLAGEQSDKRVADALILRYENYKEVV